MPANERRVPEHGICLNTGSTWTDGVRQGRKHEEWKKLEKNEIDSWVEPLKHVEEVFRRLGWCSSVWSLGGCHQLTRTFGGTFSFVAAWEPTLDSPEKDRAHDHRHKTCGLRVRHAEKGSRVDADKFNQEAAHARQD